MIRTFVLALIIASFTPFDHLDSFLYQLQGIDLEAASQTDYDLIIMDYSHDGYTPFTSEELVVVDDKILLSYLSIGEAENYRFYWEEAWDADQDGQPDPGAPAWLDESNPDWEGNYKVHYWDADWQAIVFSYLDQIIAAGFDGVYLDIIDGYEYYEDSRDTAAQEMVDLVIAIAEYARLKNPEFMIIPQNGAALVEYPEYLEVIDGIGQEDLYFGYPDEGERTPDEFVEEIEPYLDQVIAADKLVLLTAYTTDPEQIEINRELALAKGYIPFATVRDLDEMP